MNRFPLWEIMIFRQFMILGMMEIQKVAQKIECFH